MGKRKQRVDSWGHPALTEAQVIRLVENMMPKSYRPYYIGIDVLKQEWSEPFSEWNTDIIVYFKYPVCGCVDDARYAHSSLYGMRREFKEACAINKGYRDELLKDYDEEHDNDPVVPIRKMRKRIHWHKTGWDGRE